MDVKHRTLLMRLLPYSHQLYNIPNCSIGNDFVNGMAEIIDGIGPAQRKFNSEFLLLYIILVLYKNPNCSDAKGIKKLIKRRMERFKIAANHSVMTSEAETVFSNRQSSMRCNRSDSDISSTFHKMVIRGDLRRAVRFLEDSGGGQVLFPSSVDSSTDKPVSELLKEKHPPLRDVSDVHLEKYDSVPDFQDVNITEDVVEKIARWLTGSAGAVAFDSIMLRDALLRHGSASKWLRMSLANFSNWLSNSDVPWAAYCGLMVCREIALNKMPGI